MPIGTVALVLCAVVLSAAGQLFLKAGAAHLAALDRSAFILAVMRDARVLTGLACWAASTVCWLYVLRVAPLSRAYGLTSLTYVILFVAGVWLFGEEVRDVHVAGMLLIIAGVLCLLSGR